MSSSLEPRPRAWLVVALLLVAAAPGICFAVDAPTFWIAIAAFMPWDLSSAVANATMTPILCLVVAERYRATSCGGPKPCSCTIGGFTNDVGGALRDAPIGVGVILEHAAVVTIICAKLLAGITPRSATGAAKASGTSGR